MEKLFEELWYGNICPSTDYRKSTKENKVLMADLLKHYEKLISSLNDEQKKLFERYEESNLELTQSEEKEIFEYAFSLGARLIIELLH